MSEIAYKIFEPSCPSGCRTKFVRRGHYFRKTERIQRYRCTTCGKSFCHEVNFDTYNEKIRHLRIRILIDLSSGYSQRRLSRVLNISRTTLIRKFIKIAHMAKYLNQLDRSLMAHTVKEFHFDDLETFCHSKCKPLSVTMAVEENSRKILGFEVSSMPAKGLLAEISRKKYGSLPDERPQGRAQLFKNLQELVQTEGLIIKSDQNPHYVPDVKKHFPKASHITYKGRRGCVVGQGELKAGGYDPLFSLNHTYAMLRANINRLFRRTWNTTKLKDRLSMHLEIYTLFHNRYVILNPSK